MVQDPSRARSIGSDSLEWFGDLCLVPLNAANKLGLEILQQVSIVVFLLVFLAVRFCIKQSSATKRLHRDPGKIVQCVEKG